MLSVLTFRTPAEAVEKANNTPFGLSAGVWTDKGSRILWMANQLRAGVVWANTFNKFDPTSPFGGYKESGYGREGGRHGLEAYLADEPERDADERALDVRKTYKLYIGGAFPRSESGRSYVVDDAKGTFLANAAHGLPQGRPRRRAWPPARRSAAGPAGRPYNRGQVVYRIAEVLEGRRDQFVDEVQRSEGVTKRAGRGRRRRRDRPAGLVRRLGRQDRPGRRRHQPGRRRRTSTSRMPEPTGVVAVLAPQDSSLLGLVSVVAPVIVTGNTVRGRLRRTTRPLPAITLRRGARHLRRARRRGQRAHRRARRHRARRWPRTWTSTRSTSPAWPATPSRPPALEVAAAENLKRVVRAPAAEPDWTPTPGIDRMTAFLETKTVWHPIGI